MANPNTNTTVNEQKSDDTRQTSRVWKPDSIAEAWQLKQMYQENAQYIAAGTLIQFQREQGTPLNANLIRLDHFENLHGCKWITIDKEIKFEIGALTTLNQLQMNQDALKHYRVLMDAAGEVASPAVRNRATIGGNVSYQVGDTLPALLALDAEVRWYDDGEIHLDYLATYLELLKQKKSTLLMAILIPKPKEFARSYTFFQKVGRRESFIPSLVTVSLSIALDKDDKVECLAIAVGGGTTIPTRLPVVEAIMIQRTLRMEMLGSIHKKIQEAFQPVQDPFVSAEYRKNVAANLIVSELEKLIVLRKEN